MSDPVEAMGELALEAIADRLRGMTGERFFGGSYPNDPTVEREFVAAEQRRKYPQLIVLPVKGGALKRTAHKMPGGIQYEMPWEGQVIGYAERAQNLPPSTWCARLIEDIQRTLSADPTLGGIGKIVNFGEWESVEASGADGVTKLGGFDLRVTAHLSRTFPA